MPRETWEKVPLVLVDFTIFSSPPGMRLDLPSRVGAERNWGDVNQHFQRSFQIQIFEVWNWGVEICLEPVAR